MQYETDFETAYPYNRRLGYTFGAIVIAVLAAGFWHLGLVGDFGREIVAARTVGDASELALQYDTRGAGFGFVFAVIAGLAATFTACNCVVFAVLPGLACSTGGSSAHTSPGRILCLFTAPVLVVSGVYGLYVGYLGSDGIEYINQVAVRHAQSLAVFSAIGAVMLIWGCLEMGLLDSIKRRVSRTTRDFFGQVTVKATLLGILVGMFTVGRPYPVFREFLVYAASAKNPLYGAGVMMVQGIGQIALMVFLFLLIIWFAGSRISAAAIRRPHKFRLISGLALAAGGSYFIYYWGFARVFDIGRWGYKLGWYS